MKKISFIIFLLVGFVGSNLSAQYDMGMRYNEVITVPASEYPSTVAEIEEKWGGQPVLFKGAAKTWGAMGWTPEYLRDNFSDCPVETMPQDISKVSNCRSQGKYVDTTIAEHYRDVFENPQNAYYLVSTIPGVEFQITKQVLDELGPLAHCATLSARKGNSEFAASSPDIEDSFELFFGSQYTVFGLHEHKATELSMLHGEKVVYLVQDQAAVRLNYINDYCEKYLDLDCVQCCDSRLGAGCYYGNLYPLKDWVLDSPELNNEAINVFRAHLEPGDILYIPDFWGHEVHSIGDVPTVSLAHHIGW